MGVAELEAFPKLCEGAYLYRMDRAADDSTDNRQHYILGIEFADEEESAMGDSYQLYFVFDRAVFEWERYMNRVER
jgi:hypothetical protein